jgi:hypothetical protein
MVSLYPALFWLLCIYSMWGSSIVVVSNMWSDRPFNIIGSYSIFCVGSLVSIRSMRDRSVPLKKVYSAGGLGSNPFRIYQPCCSHSAIIHCALWFTWESKLFLRSSYSPMVGYNCPTLAFQSPHIATREFYGMDPVTSSIRLRATSSSVPLFFIFYAGGKYTLPTHTLSPPCVCIHTPCAYSLPTYFSTLIPFLIRIAIPPLLPLARRSS